MFEFEVSGLQSVIEDFLGYGVFVFEVSECWSWNSLGCGVFEFKVSGLLSV